MGDSHASDHSERQSRFPLNTQGFIAENIGPLPWALILIASGIGLYFALPFEPPRHYILIALIMVTMSWFAADKHPKINTGLTIALLVLTGLALAHYRTEAVKTPLLDKTAKAYNLRMIVEKATPGRASRIRYEGRLLELSSTKPQALPKRIRISMVDQGPRFEYGDIICTRAVLKRPGGPLMPGGYDFGWRLWFQSIGGTGFTISPARRCGEGRKVKSNTSWIIARIRATISERLQAGLAPREEALARTIILGDRGQINSADLEALRQAGLGHLLAISGLHMAVFAGTLFFLVRAGLALNPTWAEALPIKKYAALIALSGGLSYFMTSGQTIPTQRAFIMIVILFLAIILERPGLTLRNVILAAMVILVLQPEALLQPGFQMSFAAVTALIAVYDLKLKYDNRRHERSGNLPVKKSTVTQLLSFGFGICLTSLVATVATAPFALYHFHQISYMGPLANMFAIPVFSLAVMPLVVLSLGMMPLGLETVPLQCLTISIDALLAIAHWSASFKPAVFHLGAINASSVIFASLAALIAIFANKTQKWGAFVLLAAAFMTAKPFQKPDVLISDKGDVVAIRGLDNRLYASDGRKGEFALAKWLKAEGDGRHPVETRENNTFTCDATACTGMVKGKRVTLLRSLAALSDVCNQSDIIIYRFEIKRRCPATMMKIARFALSHGGAHALYIDQEKIKAITSEDKRRHRIWARH